MNDCGCSSVTATQKLLWKNPCVLIHVCQNHCSQSAQPLARTDVETYSFVGVAALMTASIFKDSLLQARWKRGCAGYWL